MINEVSSFLIPEFEECDMEGQTSTSMSPSKDICIDVNQLQTPTEQILYNAWKESETQRRQAEANTRLLQTQLNNLQTKLSALEKAFQKKPEKVTQKIVTNEEPLALRKEKADLKTTANNKDLQENETESNNIGGYFTEEDELERETNWILEKRRPGKKRKAVTSPRISQEMHSRNNDGQKTAGIDNLQQRSKPKEQPPPPINIIGLETYGNLQSVMASVTDKEYKVVALNNKVWKVNTPDSDTYRAVTAKLNAENIQWYTYENKQDRPIKVMARGIHPTCSKEEIITDLSEKGFKIVDAINIIKKEKQENAKGELITTKRGLPLFMLTFDKEEKIERVYGIKDILRMKVKIEPLRKTSNLIPQCKRCQGFNHTQNYCQKEPRCVKCAGKHQTSNCPVSKGSPPRCINCQGAHPANYRGCEVAKELQRLRNKSTKPQVTQIKKTSRYPQQQSESRGPDPQTSAESKKPPKNVTAQRKSGRTYAQAARATPGTTRTSNSSQDEVLEEILRRLVVLSEGLDHQKEINKKTFAKVTSLETRVNKLSKKQNG